MERNQLEPSNRVTQCLSFILKSRIVVLAGSLAQRLTSIFLMLVFTAVAFVVLAASAVVVTGESLVKTVLSQVKAPKNGSWQNLIKDEPVSPN
ncbi:hypothetical protein H6F96_08525 [Microcoleus sp. FACHB-53]|nr:hypothetical protein [Microcoleus sp. FACHB-53]